MSRAECLGVALLFSMLASGSSVRAQEACPEGQVRGDATRDHCCWPGQHWSRRRDRCSGAPACPSGFVVDGDACVASTPPAASPSAAPPVVPPPSAAPPVVPPPSAATVEPAPTAPADLPEPARATPPPEVPTQDLSQVYATPLTPPRASPPATQVEVSAPSEGDRLAVRFESASESSSFTVRVVEGELSQECRTPCTLRLPPGDATVETTETLTGRTRTRPFYIGRSMVVVFERRFPTAWVVTGSLLAAAGVGLTVTGALTEVHRVQLGGEDRRLSVGLLVPGTILIAGGVGALVWGLLQPGIHSTRSPLRASTGPRVTAFGVAPADRGAWAGMTVAF